MKSTDQSEELPPIIKLVSSILVSAINRKVQTIRFAVVGNKRRHVLGVFEKKGSKPFVQVEKIPLRLMAAVFARFKILGNLSIAEHNSVQTGTFETALQGGVYRFGITVIPALVSVKSDMGNNNPEDVIIEVASRSQVS